MRLLSLVKSAVRKIVWAFYVQGPVHNLVVATFVGYFVLMILFPLTWEKIKDDVVIAAALVLPIAIFAEFQRDRNEQVQ